MIATTKQLPVYSTLARDDGWDTEVRDIANYRRVENDPSDKASAYVSNQSSAFVHAYALGESHLIATFSAGSAKQQNVQVSSHDNGAHVKISISNMRITGIDYDNGQMIISVEPINITE